MTLRSILPEVLAGAWFGRTEDKKFALLWRIVPVAGAEEQQSFATLSARLEDVQHGRMFAVPGLERQNEDGSWAFVGALKSHEAKADDWVIVQPESERVDG